MIQQQIENFSRSLQNLATEYSDPSVIVQHIPVLKDNLMFQQNPHYLFYGLGGLVVLLILLRKLKKRRAERIKNIAMVMPQPYIGDADHANTNETAPASFDKGDLTKQAEPIEQDIADHSTIPEFEHAPKKLRLPKPTRRKSHDASEHDIKPMADQRAIARSSEVSVEDVVAVGFDPVPVLTPAEARARVLVQSVLNEFGAGYMIMARTALNAILQPSKDVAGPERAAAIAAIQGKYVDFGVFDRAGRCIVALDMETSAPEIGAKSNDRAIVRKALEQAHLPLAMLKVSDTPADIRSKIAQHLKATARPIGGAAEQSKKSTRPGRPTRPVRPAHTAAIAAE